MSKNSHNKELADLQFTTYKHHMYVLGRASIQ